MAEGSERRSAGRALAHYDVGGPRVIELLEASKRNENLLVEDGAGARYVLRRYRRNPNEARIRFQLAFQQALHDLGFPTSKVLPASDGKPFLSDRSGLWVSSRTSPAASTTSRT